MPSRYVREDYLTSEHVDKLSSAAEIFYFRLFLVVDDYGRFYANPKLLRSHLFPLKDNIRTTDIPCWLTECQKAGLLRLYKVAEKDYLEVLRFDQRIRSKSKFPEPAEIGQDDSECSSSVGNCPQSADGGQPITNPNPRTNPSNEDGNNAPAKKTEFAGKLEKIAQAYPRQSHLMEGLRELSGTVEKLFLSGRYVDEITVCNHLLDRVTAYSEAVSVWSEDEKQYIPKLSTWLANGQYKDDPKTWTRVKPGSENGKKNGKDKYEEAIRFHGGFEQ